MAWGPFPVGGRGPALPVRLAPDGRVQSAWQVSIPASHLRGGQRPALTCDPPGLAALPLISWMLRGDKD